MSLQVIENSVKAFLDLKLSDLPTTRKPLVSRNESQLDIVPLVDFMSFTTQKPAFVKVKQYFEPSNKWVNTKSVIVDDKYLWCLKSRGDPDYNIVVYVFDAYTEEFIGIRTVSMANSQYVSNELRAQNYIVLHSIHLTNEGVWLVYRLDLSNEYFVPLIGKDFVLKQWNWFPNEVESRNFLRSHQIVSDHEDTCVQKLKEKLGYYNDITKAQVFGDLAVGIVPTDATRCLIGFYDGQQFKLIVSVSSYYACNFMFRRDGKLFISVIDENKFYEFV